MRKWLLIALATGAVNVWTVLTCEEACIPIWIVVTVPLFLVAVGWVLALAIGDWRRRRRRVGEG